MSIPYSAEKDDLYYPAQHAVFFPAGRPKSDAALCVLAALKVVCCRVLFTGHSLGAATATLLASWRTPDSLYPYGSPRVGDRAFGATLKGLDKHRCVDCSDIVTGVPPKSFGYEHLGGLYYINLARQVKFNPPQTDIDNDRTAPRRKRNISRNTLGESVPSPITRRSTMSDH
jgi:hypothetical protein